MDYLESHVDACTGILVKDYTVKISRTEHHDVTVGLSNTFKWDGGHIFWRIKYNCVTTHTVVILSTG